MDTPTRRQTSPDDTSATAPSDAFVPLAIGTVVAEKYRLEGLVGRGGMGAVYVATHVALGERVALKILLPHVAKDPEVVARFQREARAAAKIKSDHIGRVNDVDRLPSGVPYMVMEYLEGEDFAARLARVGPLRTPDVVDCVLQACEGIALAHANGIVHRDLKPSNLFATFDDEGRQRVKVLDFGISKELAPENSTALTQGDSMLGSPGYMSPEQVKGHAVDARTDVWAIGALLFELLTNHLPFEAETAGGILSAILTEPPQDLRAYRPDVPEGLEQVIRGCLAKKPQDRYPSVVELAHALTTYASPLEAGRAERISRVAYVRKRAPSILDFGSLGANAPSVGPSQVPPPSFAPPPPLAPIAAPPPSVSAYAPTLPAPFPSFAPPSFPAPTAPAPAPANGAPVRSYAPPPTPGASFTSSFATRAVRRQKWVVAAVTGISVSVLGVGIVVASLWDDIVHGDRHEARDAGATSSVTASTSASIRPSAPRATSSPAPSPRR